MASKMFEFEILSTRLDQFSIQLHMSNFKTFFWIADLISQFSVHIHPEHLNSAAVEVWEWISNLSDILLDIWLLIHAGITVNLY